MEFSKWWVTNFKSIKFPPQGTVFDYYIDSESKKFEPWSKMVPKFEMDEDTPLQVQAPLLDQSRPEVRPPSLNTISTSHRSMDCNNMG